MARTYTLRRRADQQADTRRRIVEAAVDLHGTVGPAKTTISMLAEKAGVQRHTVYAHFPDERSLLMACSGHVFERDPLPDAGPWRGTNDRRARLRIGLGSVYDWYARNAGLLACVMRDAEVHPMTREIGALRFGPPFAEYEDVLSTGLSGGQRAMLQLALSFFTWRTLVGDGGLDQRSAAEAMTTAILAVDG